MANAVVLKQNFRREERDFIKEFIAEQPDGYKQGCLWTGDLDATLTTARTWARFKKYCDDQDWGFIFDEDDHPAAIIDQRLRATESIPEFDFEAAFYEFLDKHLESWQEQCQKDSETWQKRLDGTFRVRDMLRIYASDNESREWCDFRSIENAPEEVQLAAIRNTWRAIEYIKDPSATVQVAVIKAALKQYPCAIPCIITMGKVDRAFFGKCANRALLTDILLNEEIILDKGCYEYFVNDVFKNNAILRRKWLEFAKARRYNVGER